VAGVSPDAHEPGVRIIQYAEKSLVRIGVTVATIYQLVRAVLTEVPDADFIEVRAIKYQEEEGT
jgi:hypothetical protein